MPGVTTWLVAVYCASSAIGRTTSSTSAISASVRPASRNSVAGFSCDTSATTWPMNTGIVLSISATHRPNTNSATKGQGAWRRKCQ